MLNKHKNFIITQLPLLKEKDAFINELIIDKQKLFLLARHYSMLTPH